MEGLDLSPAGGWVTLAPRKMTGSRKTLGLEEQLGPWSAFTTIITTQYLNPVRIIASIYYQHRASFTTKQVNILT
jgi:hypothetical protein